MKKTIKTILMFIALILSFVILAALYQGVNSRETTNNSLETVKGVVTDKSYDFFYSRFSGGYKFFITAEYQSLTWDNEPTTETRKFKVTYETYNDIDIGDTVVIKNPSIYTSTEIVSYEKQSTKKS